MNSFTQLDLKKLFVPRSDSHKGQNGRLLIIGGSHLFHSASLWALEVASRIVDLVHYASVPENNKLVHELKKSFRNGIIVSRDTVDEYVDEDDAILIGPGMTRDRKTKELTNRLLKQHPHKQWVIDAGALQMMDISLIPKNAILTPHHQEFEGLELRIKNKESRTGDQTYEERVQFFAHEYRCILLVKGKEDVVCDGEKIVAIVGGNAGMTKGGTGDVLAGLVAALACKNDPYLSACAGSLINKSAGDDLYKEMGIYFNASDLTTQIPKTMKRVLL